MPLPADVAGYTWRAIVPDDGAALAALIAACDAADGARETGDAATRESVVATSTAGELVAAGWVERRSGTRLHLPGWVHPAHRRRGLGTALIGWLVAGARAVANTGDVLRIDRALLPASVLPADALRLYTDAAFAFNYIEYEMHRDLSRPLPDARALSSARIQPWTAHLGELSRLAYNGAFADRGGRSYDDEDWADAFFMQDDFAPASSFVAMDGDDAIGFLFSCHPGGGAGWIDSVGVVPAYRGSGIATALLCAAMRAYADAGLCSAVLRVNENNERAAGVYRGLGFARVAKHVSFHAPS